MEDCGQEHIGSIWVIMQKEKAERKKAQIKGRLVAKEFQLEDSPQSDLPTFLWESLKLYIVVSANEGFGLRSMDIRTVFSQAKCLDREVFMEPPRDIKKEGKIWKLRKPFYGLNDTSRKIWLKVKEVSQG